MLRILILELVGLEQLRLRLQLQRSHLKMGDTTFKPDFMKGSVLEQKYHGNRIAPGTKIQWGSSIDLLIASGLTDKVMAVPDMIGLTYEEAKTLLDSSGITIGAILPLGIVKDTATAFIYKQSPARLDEDKKPNFIHSGQLMDLYISAEMIYLEDSVENKMLKQ